MKGRVQIVVDHRAALRSVVLGAILRGAGTENCFGAVVSDAITWIIY